MREGNALQVFYDEKLVGTLAMTADHKAAFQYSEEWIENGFPISPFSLPLKKQVFVPTKDYFDGLFGVFADSLPDNWGRLLLDRLLRAHKQNPDKLTVLDRLAIVGKSGMGALTYYPEKKIDEQYGDVDLDDFFPDEKLDSTMVGKSQNQMSKLTYEKSKEYATRKYRENDSLIHSGKVNYMFLEIDKKTRAQVQPIGK
mgnify:CR=1 FL=1